jgi:hypothetical protein
MWVIWSLRVVVCRMVGLCVAAVVSSFCVWVGREINGLENAAMVVLGPYDLIS